MKILLVEDELLLLKTLEFKLKKEGYEVFVSKNGLEAISDIVLHQPDFVVTDIMMPVLNGLEVVNYLRNDCKSKIPVLVLSSAKHQNIITQAMDLGASDFISKPFSPDDLVRKIRTLSPSFNGNNVALA
jgi:two-component system, OmpR family, response regulator VicR